MYDVQRKAGTLSNYYQTYDENGTVPLKYIEFNNNKCLWNLLKEDEIDADIVEGTYEGGLEVWECCYDLVGYIRDHGELVRKKQVLEIGCG